MLSVVVYDIPAISIHAPASGATDNRIRELALSIISIHAPASGATAVAEHVFYIMRFQSTLPRVERLILGVSKIGAAVFQSTLPRVERQDTDRIGQRRQEFQSTLPRVERRRLQ